MCVFLITREALGPEERVTKQAVLTCRHLFYVKIMGVVGLLLFFLDTDGLVGFMGFGKVYRRRSSEIVYADLYEMDTQSNTSFCSLQTNLRKK